MNPDHCTSSGRLAKFTPEMANYLYDIRQREYKKLYVSLCDGMNRLSDAMRVPESRAAVEDLNKKFVDACDRYMKADEDYAALLIGDEEAAHTNMREERLSKIRDFKSQVVQFLTSQQSLMDDDKLSVSSHSSRSSTSSTMLRLREAQKHAEMEARTAALTPQFDLQMKKKQAEMQFRRQSQRLENELELSKLEFQRLEEETKLRTEMAVSEARSEVLDRYDNEDNLSQPTDHSYDRERIRSPTLSAELHQEHLDQSYFTHDQENTQPKRPIQSADMIGSTSGHRQWITDMTRKITDRNQDFKEGIMKRKSAIFVCSWQPTPRL